MQVQLSQFNAGQLSARLPTPALNSHNMKITNQPDLSINFSFNETTDNAGSYASAIYYVVYAYGGWYNLNYILDELKDPIKNLPRCAVSALTLTTILYILANIGNLYLNVKISLLI